MNLNSKLKRDLTEVYVQCIQCFKSSIKDYTFYNYMIRYLHFLPAFSIFSLFLA